MLKAITWLFGLTLLTASKGCPGVPIPTPIPTTTTTTTMRTSSTSVKWREDDRCGPDYPLPDGTPAQCNPDGNPCCSDFGWCGNSAEYCDCKDCIDYTEGWFISAIAGDCQTACKHNGLVCTDEKFREKIVELGSSDKLIDYIKEHVDKDFVGTECLGDLAAYNPTFTLTGEQAGWCYYQMNTENTTCSAVAQGQYFEQRVCYCHQ